MEWNTVFRLVSCLTAALSSLCLYHVIVSGHYLLGSPILLVALAVCLISFHLSTFRLAPSFSLRPLLLQYVLVQVVGRFGQLKYDTFARKCSMPKETQAAILLELLSFTKHTAYGKDHNFADIYSVEEFRKSQRLTDYSDYETYIELTKRGERNVVTPDEVVFYAATSGTSGKRRKHFPISHHAANMYMRNVLFFYFHTKRRRNHRRLDRQAAISFRGDPEYSPCGIHIGPLSSMYSRNHGPFNVSPVPSQVLNISQERTALYIEAVFYLADPYIGCFDSIFSTLVYSFIKLIESHWREMCSSIELGEFQLPTGFKIESKMVQTLNSKLLPDLTRADCLRNEFQKGMHGIMTRIWPRLSHITCVNTGSFATHARLISTIYAPGVQQISQLHASSEGILGYPTVDRESQAYTLSICLTFFEFIPAGQIHCTDPDTLLAHQLCVGECYEMVLTNMNGLYRYRLGDVIKVIDFFHRTPVYEFQYRLGQMMNLFGEKITEDVFLSALYKSLDRLHGATLVDYTVCESEHYETAAGVRTDNVYYVLFVELLETVTMSTEDMNKFDQCLMEEDDAYRGLRDSEVLGSMKVLAVNTGGFYRLKMCMMSDRHTMQFKMPRVLRKTDLISLLLRESGQTYT